MLVELWQLFFYNLPISAWQSWQRPAGLGAVHMHCLKAFFSSPWKNEEVLCILVQVSAKFLSPGNFWAKHCSNFYNTAPGPWSAQTPQRSFSATLAGLQPTSFPITGDTTGNSSPPESPSSNPAPFVLFPGRRKAREEGVMLNQQAGSATCLR